MTAFGIGFMALALLSAAPASARNLVQLFFEFDAGKPTIRLLDSEDITRRGDIATVHSYQGMTTDSGDTFISAVRHEVDCRKNVLRDAETRYFSAEGKPETKYGPEPDWRTPPEGTVDEAVALFACGQESLDDWIGRGDHDPIMLLVEMLKQRPADSI